MTRPHDPAVDRDRRCAPGARCLRSSGACGRRRGGPSPLGKIPAPWRHALDQRSRVATSIAGRATPASATIDATTETSYASCSCDLAIKTYESSSTDFLSVMPWKLHGTSSRACRENPARSKIERRRADDGSSHRRGSVGRPNCSRYLSASFSEALSVLTLVPASSRWHASHPSVAIPQPLHSYLAPSIERQPKRVTRAVQYCTGICNRKVHHLRRC